MIIKDEIYLTQMVTNKTCVICDSAECGLGIYNTHPVKENQPAYGRLKSIAAGSVDLSSQCYH